MLYRDYLLSLETNLLPLLTVVSIIGLLIAVRRYWDWDNSTLPLCTSIVFVLAAIGAARAGDIIEIDASEVYRGDVCGWKTDNLTLRGVGGRAKLDANGRNSKGKGIWVIGGKNNVVRLNDNALQFPNAKLQHSIVDIAARTSRLEKDFRKLLGHKIRVRSVIAVPGCSFSRHLTRAESW